LCRSGHLRRNPAPSRDADLEDHRRDQQGPGRPDLRRRGLRRRRGPLHGCAPDDQSARSVNEVDAMEERTLRRGLPRVIGGDAWPPPRLLDTVEESDRPAVEASRTTRETCAGLKPTTARTPAALGVTPEPPTQREGIQQTTVLRRGLPRVAHGEPWPPATMNAEATVLTSKEVVAPAKTTPTAP